MGNLKKPLELWFLALATCGILLLDAPINELHGTAVFYASLVRELFDNGYLSIFADERAYFLKPPLVLWLSTASAKIFGLTNFGVSFVPRVAGVLCVALCYLMTKKLFDQRVALFSSLVLITNSTFIQFSATLRMDSMLLLGGLISVAGWLYRDRTWSSVAIFAGITIGVLSKGPLGFAPIVLILIHSVLFKVNVTQTINWRWFVLLGPILFWYGFLMATHGTAPFVDLSNDLAKPAADANANLFIETFREYIAKPAGRYLPWLPFMLIGGVLGLRHSFSDDHRYQKIMRWLILWFALVFVAAAAKPDKDIRYLYMGLPVLSMLAGYVLAKIEHRFKLHWMGIALCGFIFVLPLAYNFGPYRETDTRPTIEAMSTKIATTETPVVIGGYPIPAGQARRQNTHRDWIYFYLNKEPRVLAWSQISPADMTKGEGYFLTNNRSHEARLAEYRLTPKFKTTEMVYAIRE
ncbi:MAG: glycosyltransferase family 39 protein [Pseudomonadota bacterium]